MKVLMLLVAIVVLVLCVPAWAAIFVGVTGAFLVTMGPLAALGIALGLIFISWLCRYQEPEE